VTVRTVAEALALIPGRRDMLDRIDDQLSRVIRHVEQVLKELRPGVPTDVTYETPDGIYALTFGKLAAQWHILHGRDEDDAQDYPLLSASRLTRAEVFMPDAHGVTPIDRLIIAVVDSLERHAQERSPQVEAANRLAQVLEAAGFPAPSGS
jgi:hypothetical protein